MTADKIDSRNYYQNKALSYFETTVQYDMSYLYELFLPYIPKNGSILDAGCGSGRDTKYFLNHGYDVAAFDGTKKMAELAAEYTGINVVHRTFAEVDEIEQYDGIWASASLLHVHKQDLIGAMSNLKAALKKGGVWYMSFRYGLEESFDDDRYFNDQTESSLQSLIGTLGDLEIIHLETPDQLRSRRGYRFVIAIVRKFS